MIQLKEGETIDDYIKRRRTELLGDTLPTPRDTITPQDTTSPSTFNAGGINDEQSFLQSIRERMIGLLPEVSEEEMSEFNENVASGPGILGTLSPGGAGLGSAAGKAGVLRKTLASRPTAGKITEKLPQIADDVAEAGGQLYEQGVKLWSNALKGPNPSEFGRTLAKVPAERLDEFRLGMLEGLVENLQNLPRLTKAAQRNLTSPAGRTMLRETLSELPDEAFETFMALLEKGQFQEWRNRAFIIAAVYPVLRFGKDPILKMLGF